MAQQKGRDFVLKYNTTGTTFVTVGGLRDVSITINGKAVDATHKGSSGWQTLLADAGVQSVEVSASGLFDGDTAGDGVEAAAIAGTLKAFQVVAANGDEYEGTFEITNFTRNGAFDGVEQFSISLRSSGAVTFTAGA